MSQRHQLDLFAAKLTKRDEMDWLRIFQQPDFLSIGLCQRHVQIDDTGRDWFGMPFLVDADCARVQGSPFVAKLDTEEAYLNKLLWQLDTLSQRQDSLSARINYSNHLDRRQPGEVALTPTQCLEKQVRLYVECGIYPSPNIAAGIARREGEGLPDFDEEGNSIPSPFEKFIFLDYVSQVIISLEYCIQWKRQDIYFDAFTTRERSDLARAEGIRQAESQTYWARIDAEREQLRQRGRQHEPVPVVVEQLDMFPMEVVADG